MTDESVANWTIHISRGRVSLSIRLDGEMGEGVYKQLNHTLDVVGNLAAALDSDH
jgi:hypothetical protein